jgi:alkylation response protein AidB-like acyl-CoA dehydrogenase
LKALDLFGATIGEEYGGRGPSTWIYIEEGGLGLDGALIAPMSPIEANT